MSLKKLKDYANNDIQVESAIKDAKGQTIHSTYATKSEAVSNPMNSQGDLIVGGVDGVASRLALGTSGQVLTSNGTTATWANQSGMTNPMTTSQDIIVGGSSGTPTRLAKGSNGTLLGVNGSGNLAYTNSLPIITTAPSSANSNGLIIVVLSSEPSTKYSGYLYIITQ